MRAGPISAWSILLRDGDAPKQSERFGTDQSQRGDPDSHVKHALARHSPHDRLIRPSGREATRHPTPFATSAVPWANCLDVVLPGRGEICPAQLVQPTHPRRRTGVQRRCRADFCKEVGRSKLGKSGTPMSAFKQSFPPNDRFGWARSRPFL
jgi:hypothetical protein